MKKNPSEKVAKNPIRKRFSAYLSATGVSRDAINNYTGWVRDILGKSLDEINEMDEKSIVPNPKSERDLSNRMSAFNGYKNFLEFEKRIENVKVNPMHTFSLGNKELFHSNVIAWLFNEILDDDSKINLFKTLFPQANKFIDEHKDNIIDVSLEREKNHYDLFLEIDDATFVVENKMTSYPTQEQLNKYKDSVKSTNKFFTLLAPISYSEITGWKTVSYSDILECLKKCKIKEDINKEFDYASLIKKYIEYISDICEFFELLQRNGQSFSDLFEKNNDFYSMLDSIKLKSIYAKNRMNKFGESLELGQNFEFAVGFSRGLPHISIWHIKDRSEDEKDENKGKRGIQIQGSQIRYYVKLTDPQKESLKKHLEFDVFGSSKKIQDDKKGNIDGKIGEFIKKENIIKYPETCTSSCCKFKPNFLYRYENLDELDDIKNVKEKIENFFDLNK